jgi:hypothetical protein
VHSAANKYRFSNALYIILYWLLSASNITSIYVDKNLLVEEDDSFIVVFCIYLTQAGAYLKQGKFEDSERTLMQVLRILISLSRGH